MSKRYAMVMDTRKCVGCNACVFACKNENKVPEGYCRDWVTRAVKGKYPVLSEEIRSERCNHCASPSCVHACPTGASFVGEGGVVLVTHDKCTGCKACIASCPYDARYVHPDGYVDKCTFCFHRVKEGKLPACVTVCPTTALHFGDINDPHSEVSRLLVENDWEVQHPETGNLPQLYFLK